MRRILTVVSLLLGTLVLVGCGPTRTEIRTETTRTEQTLEREIVDPGTESTGEETAGEEVETTTETEERVRDTRPLIR